MIILKIYVVQNLDYNWYEMIYVGTDIEKANEAILNYKYDTRYVRGSVWENGIEIADDLKDFNGKDI